MGGAVAVFKAGFLTYTVKLAEQERRS